MLRRSLCEPEVSVIIPAYNAQNTLERALDSVINQENCLFEILVCNDGSSDDTKKIIDSYAKRDSRIRGIHQENRGRSAARNSCLEQASGAWLFFLDADDALCPSELSSLLHDATERTCCVWGGYIDSAHDGSAFCDSGAVDASIMVDALLHPKTGQFLPACSSTVYRTVWGKLYRRDVVLAHDVRFIEGLRFGEDALFNLEYLKYCQSVMLSKTAGYFYDTSASSTASSFSLEDGACLHSFVQAVLRVAGDNENKRELTLSNYEEFVGVEVSWRLNLAVRSDYPVDQIVDSLKVVLEDSFVRKCVFHLRGNRGIHGLRVFARNVLLKLRAYRLALVLERALHLLRVGKSGKAI